MNMDVKTCLKIFFLFCFLGITAIGVNANPLAPQEEWNKTFGGSKDEIFTAVQQSSDGGYVLVGVTKTYGAGESDAWLIKTDSRGNEEWNRTFGGPLKDEGNSVRQSGGGYIIAGRTDSYGKLGDIWLIKTDSRGNEEWNRTINCFQLEVLRSLIITPEEEYIFVGEVGDRRYSDIVLIKTDSRGNEYWNKTLGGSIGDYSHSLYRLKDGYMVAGHKCNGKDCDAWLMKTDMDGNETWNKTYGGKEFDVASSINQTSDGGYIISGFTQSYGEGRNDVWVVKTNSSGKEEWNRTIGGIMEDAATSVHQTEDSGYIVAGYTTSHTGENKNVDAVLIKLSSASPSPNNSLSTSTPPEPEGIAGFEVLLAVAGLLAGVYLLRGRM